MDLLGLAKGVHGAMDHHGRFSTARGLDRVVEDNIRRFVEAHVIHHDIVGVGKVRVGQDTNVERRGEL